MKEYMPLGSVVTLKQGTKKLMITGRLQRESESGLVFDYCAVLWPEGLIASDQLYLFDHEDIDLIWYVGMQNEEEFSFRHQLDEMLEKEGAAV